MKHLALIIRIMLNRTTVDDALLLYRSHRNLFINNKYKSSKNKLLYDAELLLKEEEKFRKLSELYYSEWRTRKEKHKLYMP